jgi:hypothetical protein
MGSEEKIELKQLDSLKTNLYENFSKRKNPKMSIKTDVSR